MIELSKHRTSLVNMQYTIEGLERLDHLIDIYAKPLPGPSYVIFQGLNGEKIETQIDRSFIVPALEQQRDKLIAYMATLGIDATK